MKKKYIQPSIKSVEIKMTKMVCGSQDISSDKGIGYGGVDDEGNKDPASRRHRDVWEEEEEDQ